MPDLAAVLNAPAVQAAAAVLGAGGALWLLLTQGRRWPGALALGLASAVALGAAWQRAQPVDPAESLARQPAHVPAVVRGAPTPVTVATTPGLDRTGDHKRPLGPQGDPGAKRAGHDDRRDAAAAGSVTGHGSEGDYIGAEACRSCHQHAWTSWHDSFHRTMTQRPTAATVIGDFDGEPRRAKGRVWRMIAERDGWYAEGPDPAFAGPPSQAPRLKRKVVLLTGKHHQQVYWVASGEARKLTMIPLVWFERERRWVPYNSLFIEPPPKPGQLPKLPPVGLWNMSCIQCHTTAPRQRYGDSHVSDLGIACESCHGPGRQHADTHRSPVARYLRHLGVEARDPMAHPEDMDPKRSSEVCGQCHGMSIVDGTKHDLVQRRGASFRPGDKLGDHTLSGDYSGFTGADGRMIDGAFWRDGGLRVAGREWSAMKRSPCAKAGDMSCVSCHVMHPKRTGAPWRDDQLKPDMRADKACTGCHTALAAKLTTHTHHAADSEGSRCLNCHNPNTAWSLLKATRDHEVTVPDPAAAHRIGKPNACNLCHLDRTESWAVMETQRLWGRGQGGVSVAAAQVAAGVRWLLSGEAGVRALAAWHMGWEPALAASGRGWQVPFLTLALMDPYGAVRGTARASLARYEGWQPAGYDPDAAVGERATAVRAQLLRWKANPAPSAQRARRPAVPLDATGRLEGARVDQLSAQRDDRFVNLRE